VKCYDPRQLWCTAEGGFRRPSNVPFLGIRPSVRHQPSRRTGAFAFEVPRPAGAPHYSPGKHIGTTTPISMPFPRTCRITLPAPRAGFFNHISAGIQRPRVFLSPAPPFLADCPASAQRPIRIKRGFLPCPSGPPINCVSLGGRFLMYKPMSKLL